MLGKSKTVRTIRHFTRFYVVYLLEAKENKHLKCFIKKKLHVVLDFCPFLIMVSFLMKDMFLMEYSKITIIF